MTSDLKFNVNKIDSELKNLFENVYITEKSNKSEFYLEINANSLFTNEGQGFKSRINVIAEINKIDASKQNIKWRYYTNPSDITTSHVIERTSHIDSIAKDIYEIATKKKLESKYFESLEHVYDLINENNTNTNIDIQSKIKNVLNTFNITTESITENKNIDLEKYDFMSVKADSTINVKYNNTLKYSEMFNVEKELLKIEGVKSVVFNSNNLKIDYSPC